MKLDYKVVNYDHNSNKIFFFNIFRNITVDEYTKKLYKDYVKGKYDFKGFVDKLDNIIQWQEWGRCEYEFIASAFTSDDERREQSERKLDCYEQAHENIETIAHYVIYTLSKGKRYE